VGAFGRRFPKRAAAPSSASTRSGGPPSSRSPDTGLPRAAHGISGSARASISPNPGPDSIEEGALVVRRPLGALLPATRVRVAYRHLPTGCSRRAHRGGVRRRARVAERPAA